jgi:hypothetical protein
MVRNSQGGASEQQGDNNKVPESQQNRTGEGAASALASMQKQRRQLRREAGKTAEDRTLGGPP